MQWRAIDKSYKIQYYIKMRLLFLLSVLFLTAPSFANDFDEGLYAIHGTDYDKALEKLMPLALQGHSAAQYNLGVMHEWGNGVPQDDVKAMKWYRLAAEKSHRDAQNNLGAMYSKGEGVEQNYVEALKWYKLAEKLDKSGTFTFDLGSLYLKAAEQATTRKDYRQAADIHKEALASGHKQSAPYLCSGPLILDTFQATFSNSAIF